MEAVVPIEYVVPSLQIATAEKLSLDESIGPHKEQLHQLGARTDSRACT